MIQICNLRHIKLSEPYDVRVDRHSPLGNPFVMGKESMRHIVCNKYTTWFAEKTKNFKEFSTTIPEDESQVYHELFRLYCLWKEHGKLRLFCWCAPKRCHAETIKQFLESY